MFSCVYGLLGSYRKEGSMCFIGLIGKEQLPCCISTIFLSSTALAGEPALRAVRGALAVPLLLLRRTRRGLLCRERERERGVSLSRACAHTHTHTHRHQTTEYKLFCRVNVRWKVCVCVCSVLDCGAAPFISHEERRSWMLL